MKLKGLTNDEYACVIMQGSGTFGNESVIHTITPRNKDNVNYLILENGAYGVRLAKMCNLLGIKNHMASFPEERALDLKKVEDLLKNSSYTHVAAVHNETTSGVLNDVEAIGKMVKQHLPGSCFSKLDFFFKKRLFMFSCISPLIFN